MSSNIQATTRNALGRMHEIGEIFNAINDKFLGIQAFTEAYDKYINETDCGGNEFVIIDEETLENKFEKMNLEKELKLSLIAGLVKLEGIGKYFNEINSNNEKISFSVILKVRTKRQILKIFNRKLRNDNNFPSDLIDPNLGTHLINGITWGAQIIATFSMDTNKLKSYLNYQGNLKAFIQKISMEILNKSLILKSENYEWYKNNVSVRIIGDIIPMNQNSLLTDLDGFEKFMKDIPSILNKTNKGRGIPLEYNLIPFSMLFEKDIPCRNKCFNEIGEETIRKIVKFIDSSKLVQNQINFAINECFKLEAIFKKEIEELSDIKEKLDADLVNFRSKIKRKLIDYRLNEDPSNDYFDKLIDLNPQKNSK